MKTRLLLLLTLTVLLTAPGGGGELVILHLDPPVLTSNGYEAAVSFRAPTNGLYEIRVARDPAGPWRSAAFYRVSSNVTAAYAFNVTPAETGRFFVQLRSQP